MVKTYKQTLAASLTALLVAAPALAQQDDTDEATGTQQTTTGEQAQNQSPEAEMPEAATPEGQGLSDIADVDNPPGELGAASDTTTADTQPAAGTQGTAGAQGTAGTQSTEGTRDTTGQQGDMPGDQGRMVVLDVEGFSEQIYERGFRQGYIRGIADARERFMSELERSRAMISQRDRSQGATQGGAMPGGDTGDQQAAQDDAARSGEQQQATGQQQDQQMAGDGSGERGTIIVLPPGITPEMFVERLMQQGN